MDAARWKQVRALFEELNDLPPERRLQALEQRCPGDAELRTEVEALLEEDSRSGRFTALLDGLPARARTSGESATAALRRLAERQGGEQRLRLEGEIARGGMGAVLRVWDEDLQRPLAMKVALDGRDSRGAARFLREAQVTGQLDHPGIVPVHELGLDPQGRLYFTMKLVQGRTLGEVFAELARGEGGWTRVRVLGLLQRVCEAVAYAHAKGVIHRDLKPANVMIGRFGEVLVMDWGLAKLVGESEDGEASGEIGAPTREARSPDTTTQATLEGDVLGTPSYMAPEQALGHVDELGPQADVYAVGAMLYELLSGSRPYVPPGSSSSHLEVWTRVREGPPPPLRELAPTAEPELVAICERAMQRDSKGRYSDLSELARDLTAFLEGRVVPVYESGAWAEARKWVLRNRALAGALGATLVALVVGLAVSLSEKARADAKALEALDNMTRAQQESAKVLRLSDAKVLEGLLQESDSLWPAEPALIPRLEDWRRRAQELVDRLALHGETLAAMRADAGPWTVEQRAHDRATHPRAQELVLKQGELATHLAQIERGLLPGIDEQVEQLATELEAELADLEVEVSARRTWQLGTPEAQWQHDVLTHLVSDLEGLRDGLLAPRCTTPDHGWSVPMRLERARELEAAFAPGGECAEAWAAALPALREAYPGLQLRPQMGLLPLGPDPGSGLWEFAHLPTGEPAERAADGRLILAAETGVVLVLLPGNLFWMGAQADDEDGLNYDPAAIPRDGPVHQVEVSPFFLAKHELTQGQWERLTGARPSHYKFFGLQNSPLHPVEQVSWDQCTTWLARAALTLPSEAQWEYGARGGTDTPWWTGFERETLRDRHAANLADQAGVRMGAVWPDIEDWPDLDDGFGAHSRVDWFAPNDFGLYGVAGNVWEWCLDDWVEEAYTQHAARDPLMTHQGTVQRVNRGGSFANSAFGARSARRVGYARWSTDNNLGVRAARALDATP